MRRFKLSYANVMSTVAVFIALGGSAVAVTQLGKNSVKSRHIAPGQVKGSDLGSASVNSQKVADGSLLNQDFAPGQVPRGPAGATGAQGPPGPQGATGPLGPAGGDLTGTYPNPAVASGAIDGEAVADDQLTGWDIDERTLTNQFSTSDSRDPNPDTGLGQYMLVSNPGADGYLAHYPGQRIVAMATLELWDNQNDPSQATCRLYRIPNDGVNSPVPFGQTAWVDMTTAGDDEQVTLMGSVVPTEGDNGTGLLSSQVRVDCSGDFDIMFDAGDLLVWTVNGGPWG